MATNGSKKDANVRLSERTGKPVEIRTKDGKTQYKCEYCGKWLSNEAAVEAEHGDHCQRLREAGYNDEKLADIRAKRTVAEIPIVENGSFKGKPWIKTSVLHKILNNEGIPVARMVSAMGGDRGIEPASRTEFQFVYCGRARWVHPWAASPDGLNYLREYRKEGATEKALASKPVGATKTGTRKRKTVVKKTKVEATAEALLTK
jgi:hypothetical protein